jgi:hypothetical protein
MSRTKDEIEESQSNWHALVQAKGYRCLECFCAIPYEERDTYFASGLCDRCHSRRSKDDDASRS